MKHGFTMLEIMLAVMILSIMTIVSTMTFNSIVNGWNVATEMADNMQRVDYVTTQIEGALRSAYFPENPGTVSDQKSLGFMLLKDGDANTPDTRDTISWIKLGPTIVGRNSRFANSQHKIILSVKDPEGDNPGGLVADVISNDLRPDDFDEEDEENWDHFYLNPNVQGLNCLVLNKDEPFKTTGEANWDNKWDTSNSLPRKVQLTFWMKPLEEGKEPYPIVRVVEIPLWYISQNQDQDSDSGDGGLGGRNQGGSGTRPGSGGNQGGNGGTGTRPESGGNQGGGTGSRPGGGMNQGGGGGGMPPAGGGMGPMGGGMRM